MARSALFSTTLRGLVRSPGFAALSILTLALGIGATSAIFSIVHGVLIAPLPYPESERLVAVDHVAPGVGIDDVGMTDTLYVTYREHGRRLAEIGIHRPEAVNLTGDGEPERLVASRATPSLFAALGVAPAVGRGLIEADGAPGAEPVVVLGDGIWRQRFGADPGVIERTLSIDGVLHRVAGVLPAGFAFPDADTRIWLPLTVDPAELEDGNFNFEAVARLAPGATLESAREDLAPLVARSLELHPGDLTPAMLEGAGLAIAVRPLRDEVIGDVGEALWVLLAGVGAILMIACANVANLFLVRAEGRQQEVAVRTALGAGRGHLARAFLTESLVLALAGGAAGLGLAALGVRALVAFGPDNLPRLHEVGLHPPVLLFTLGITLAAGLVLGAVPMVRYRRRFALAGALKESGRGFTAGRARHLARNALVVSQMALALLLLVGAGLMVRTYWRLSHADPGFDPRGVLTVQLALTEAAYPEDADVVRFSLALLERLRGLPGVTAAGLGGGLPLDGNMSNSGQAFEDFPVEPGGLPPILPERRVAPGYFEALSVPVVEGRTFEVADVEESRKVAVISEPLARRLWPDQSAVGKRLQPGLGDLEWLTVVGVVGGTRDVGLDRPPIEAVYYPVNTALEGDGWWVPRGLSLTLRTAGDPLALAGAVRAEVRALDPEIPLARMRTMERVVADSGARTAFTMALMVLAGGLALALAAIGLYGVVAYGVGQRTREIGVRMALGASGGRVAGMVVRQGLTVAAAGVVLGWGAALVATRWMSSLLLFEVGAVDAATYAATALALAGVAAAASWLPARRAAAVDPQIALKNG